SKGEKRPKRRVSKDVLIPNEVTWQTGANRIDAILGELKRTNIPSQLNACCVLFRSYLDMLVYQYLKRTKGLDLLKRQEQTRLDEENNKAVVKMHDYIRSLGVGDKRIEE